MDDWQNLSQAQTCLTTTSGHCQQKNSNLYHDHEKDHDYDQDNDNRNQSKKDVELVSVSSFQTSVPNVQNQYIFNQAMAASLLLRGPLLNSNYWIYSHLYNLSNDWSSLRDDNKVLSTITSSKYKQTPSSSTPKATSTSTTNSKKSNFWRPY